MEDGTATGRDAVEIVLADARRYPFLAEQLEIDSPGTYRAGRELIEALRRLRGRANDAFVGADPRRELVLGHLIDAEGTIRGKMAQYMDREPE